MKIINRFLAIIFIVFSGLSNSYSQLNFENGYVVGIHKLRKRADKHVLDVKYFSYLHRAFGGCTAGLLESGFRKNFIHVRFFNNIAFAGVYEFGAEKVCDY